jgi:hypothetical protein
MADPPVNRDVPYCGDGPAVPGTQLHVTMGNWNGEPTSYGYQWRRGNTPVGSGENTYTCTELDVGYEISCIVTATNLVGSTVAPPSNGHMVGEAPPPPPPE